MAYRLIKAIIARGNYNKQNILEKIDAFYAFDKITTEQYKELVTLTEDDSNNN